MIGFGALSETDGLQACTTKETQNLVLDVPGSSFLDDSLMFENKSESLPEDKESSKERDKKENPE